MQTLVSIALVLFSIYLVIEAFIVLRGLKGGGFGREEMLAICLIVAGGSGIMLYSLDLLSFIGFHVNQSWLDRAYLARGCFNVLLPLMFLMALKRQVRALKGKEDV